MSNYHLWGDTHHLWGDSGRLWGSPGFFGDPVIYWMIEVDWANSGTYSGENEAKYCVDMEVNAGRTSRLNIDGNGNADGIQMPAVGTARIVLDNTSRRFDPYYASGALYGNILPGRYIKIRVMYQGTIRPIFHGNIKTITAQNGDNPTVTIDCEDGLRLLQGADVNVSLSENVYMRNAAYQILDDIDWPSRFGTSLTGVELPTNPNEDKFIIPYYSASGSAKQRIQDLANAYAGNFWVDAKGVARFEHFTLWINFPDPVFQIKEANTLKDIGVPMPWENIINSWKLYYSPLERQATGVIWKDSDITTPIGVGESITIWAEYAYNNAACQALGVIAPVANTDYTMNTSSDGSGSDLTASFTVVQTDFGSKSKLVITNNSASIGYKTLLQIRGDAIAAKNQSYLATENAGSIANYGKKTITVKSPYSQTYSSVAGIFIYISQIYEKEILLEVQIEVRPDIQFNAELFDSIYAYFPTYGVNDLGVPTDPVLKIIGHINYKWLSPSGQAVRTTFILEDDR